MPTKKQLETQVNVLQEQLQSTAKQGALAGEKCEQLKELLADALSHHQNTRKALKESLDKAHLQGKYIKALRENGWARDHQINSTICLVAHLIDFLIDGGIMTEDELGGRGFHV